MKDLDLVSRLFSQHYSAALRSWFAISRRADGPQEFHGRLVQEAVEDESHPERGLPTGNPVLVNWRIATMR